MEAFSQRYIAHVCCMSLSHTKKKKEEISLIFDYKYVFRVIIIPHGIVVCQETVTSVLYKSGLLDVQSIPNQNVVNLARFVVYTLISATLCWILKKQEENKEI